MPQNETISPDDKLNSTLPGTPAAPEDSAAELTETELDAIAGGALHYNHNQNY